MIRKFCWINEQFSWKDKESLKEESFEDTIFKKMKFLKDLSKKELVINFFFHFANSIILFCFITKSNN